MDEFGRCFTEQRVSSYLQETLEFLETAKDPNLGYPADDHNLVQQWAWYGIWTEPEMAGTSGNLLLQDYENYAPDAPTALTKAGNVYRDRCAWGRITEWASNTWSGVPLGPHTYWVRIDSHNNIGDEIDEENNVLSGQVTITSLASFYPLSPAPYSLSPNG